MQRTTGRSDASKRMTSMLPLQFALARQRSLILCLVRSMNSATVWRSLLISIVLAAAIASAKAEPPRTALKAPPRISGREVKELVLAAPVNMGTPLPPGLPTVRIFTVKPNRFVPVSEDPSSVYYQAEGAFAEGTGEPGGLRVSKIYPDKVCAYWGNGRYLKIKLDWYDCMLPRDLRKIRVRFAQSRTKR